MGMLRVDGGLDHRSVPWEDARVVGYQQRTACGGHMPDAGGLAPPVVAIQRLEDGDEGLRPLRVKSKIVDCVVRTPSRQLALLIDELDHLHDSVHVKDLTARDLAQAGRKSAERLERVHRRLALQPPDRLRQPEALRRRPPHPRRAAGAAAFPPGSCGRTILLYSPPFLGGGVASA